MAIRASAPRSREHLGAAREPVQERARPHDRGARGGELDRERHAVELAHDLGDERGVGGREREAAAGALGAANEEGDGVGVLDRRGPVRQAERPELARGLAFEPEPLARRDQEPRLGRSLEPSPDGRGGVRAEVIEIVEEQQHLPA